MDQSERLEKLEAVIAQMLQPIRGIPFDLIVKGLCGHSVIAMNPEDPKDIEVIKTLGQVAALCGRELCLKPIVRPRPNEAGNDIEAYVRDALGKHGYKTVSPRSKSGMAKATGYPDILFYDGHGRPCYLECKTYSKDTASTTMRSFYLSPSEDFKVSMEGRHLVLSFEMVRKPISGSRDSNYTAVAYKLLDIKNLECDVKHEFNSDNRRLYADGIVIDSGTV